MRVFIFAVMCIVYSTANVLEDLLKKVEILDKNVSRLQKLEERVKKLESMVSVVLTKGQVKRLLDEDAPKIAFDAVLSKNYVLGEQDFVLKFDKVLTNIGNGYDANTGIFTVKVGGTYLFSWNIRSGYGASILTKLMKNGVSIQATHTDSGIQRAFEAHSSKTAILTLGVGDRIYIENFPQRGEIHSDDIIGHTGFVGTLLFST